MRFKILFLCSFFRHLVPQSLHHPIWLTASSPPTLGFGSYDKPRSLALAVSLRAAASPARTPKATCMWVSVPCWALSLLLGHSACHSPFPAPAALQISRLETRTSVRSTILTDQNSSWGCAFQSCSFHQGTRFCEYLSILMLSYHILHVRHRSQDLTYINTNNSSRQELSSCYTQEGFPDSPEILPLIRCSQDLNHSFGF